MPANAQRARDHLKRKAVATDRGQASGLSTDLRKEKGNAMRRWYSPRSIARSISIRPKLYLSALAGAAVLVLAPASLSANVRGVLAWDVSAFIYSSPCSE